MSQSKYPRTYRALELLEAAQREVKEAMQAELSTDDAQDAPALLLVLNDPVRDGTILSAFGDYRQMAVSLATVLSAPEHALLKQLLVVQLLSMQFAKPTN